MTLNEAAITAGMNAAYEEAAAGLAEGGIPIGASLMLDGSVIARGRNQRVQQNSQILHGEMSCLENAGRRNDYGDLVLFTTLSPCMMCSGTIIQFGVGTVVIGDIQNFGGNEEFLRQNGVSVLVREDPRCVEMMRRYIHDNPAIWNEDISERG